jgi:hypothetical protein
MKTITVEFDVSPWLDKEGLTVYWFAGESYEALGVHFSLEELIDRELESYTIAGKLIDPREVHGFVKSLRKAFKYAEKRVKELS